MKKSLGVAASLALIWSSQPASAEWLKNLRVGGQIDVQATSANNVTDFSTRQTIPPVAAPGGGSVGSLNNDRIGDVQTRVMVNLDWDLLDDVHSRITLRKSDRTWGTTGGTTAAGTGQTITATGGSNVLGNVVVDEANFKIDKIAGQVDLTMGRQYYGSSGDLVIYYGPSDKAEYGLPVTALDAARADWNNEWLGVTGIAGKVTGHPIGLAGAVSDVDVTGLNMALKGTENYSGALYIYNRMTHNTGASGAPPSDAPSAGGKPDMLYVVGTKIKLAGMGLWWRGEYDQNFGDERLKPASINQLPAAHYAGYAFLTNAGYKYESESAGMASIWGEFALGSGRQNTRENSDDGFQSINSDYRPGSIYGRFAANAVSGVALGNAVAAGGPTGTSGLTSPVVTAGASSAAGLNNRMIWGVGLRGSPGFANKLTVGVSFWDYRLHRFTNVPGVNAPLQGNKHIGSEIDVDLVWTHSENVAFATGWGTFQPGGLIYEANRAAAPTGGLGTNPATMVYFDTRVKF